MTRERPHGFLIQYAKMVAQGVAPGREMILAHRDAIGQGREGRSEAGRIVKSFFALYARSNYLLPG
jgi:hypothetical protein